MTAWTGILNRLAEEVDAPGIHCMAGVHGPAEDLSRRKLVGLAQSAGRKFQELGVGPGDCVVTILPTGRPLLQTLFGAWAARAAICVIAPSIETGRSSLSIDRLSAMLRVAAPKIMVAIPEDRETLQPIADSIGAKLMCPADLPDETSDPSGLPQSRPHEAAFIQFSSGSTGVPKAIVIEHAQLTENICSIARRISFGPTDTMVSWLPIHHDMGLVFGLLLAVQAGSRLILIPTDSFVRNPVIWLTAIDRWRGTFSAAPPFSMHILSKPIFARRTANVDLSCLKYILVGAEPVSAVLVRDFEETYAGQGLRPGVLSSGYGMAEATLVTSMPKLYGPRRIAWIDKKAFHAEGVAKIVPARAADSIPLLANGPPLDCINVRIVGENGDELPEGTQGRISISGQTVTRRFLGTDEEPTSGGWLDTGDLGFLLNGEVYVSGRAKDVIIRGGANIHPHEIEEAVLRAFPDLTVRAVAFAVPRVSDLRDEIVVGVEMTSLPAPEGFTVELREIVARDLGLQIDLVIPLAKGTVPRTTSGKIQRGVARDLFRAGRLESKS